MYYDEIVYGMMGIAKGKVELKLDGKDEDRFIAIENALEKHFDAEITQDLGNVLQELDAKELDFELDTIQFVVFRDNGDNYLLCDYQDLDLYEHIRAPEFNVNELKIGA